MPLQLEQIREILKTPKRQSDAQRASAYEDRIRFHTETAIDAKGSEYVGSFLSWVKGMLPADKYAAFLQFFTFPVYTVDLVEEIYHALEKVFEGRDVLERFEFSSPEASADWDEFRAKMGDVWRNDAWQAMQFMINSILVADLPSEQNGSLPTPYLYWLDIGKVIDFALVDEVQFEYIIFEVEKNKIAVFDDQWYRVFLLNDQKEIAETLVENPHDLGYCPARFYWTTFTKPSEKWLKKGPISNQLGNLDWLLYFAVSKRYLDSYAAYPAMWGFADDCSYEGTTGRDNQPVECDGGKLRTLDGDWLWQGEYLMDCPKCAKSKLMGAGTYIAVDPPDISNDKADLREPIGIVPIDRASLDYNVDEVTRLEHDIFARTVGYDQEPQNNQAINEKQVQSQFESRKTVLRSIAKNLEAAKEWSLKTLALLRYGQRFNSCSISLGTEFFLDSPESLLDQYHEAKERQADSAVLDQLQDQYLESKYRHNPVELKRQRLLKHLEPFRHLTREEAQALAEGQPDYYLKANFSSLILRFEREQASILDFGANLEFDQQVKRIREVLLSYLVLEPAE